MLEMATVLLASAFLIVIAYEFTLIMSSKRVWGENHKSFF